MDKTNPALAFGSWKLSPEEAAETLKEALEAGFRRIDTAAAYGNEAQLAEGLARAGLPRQALFVSGKLWNSRRDPDKVEKACGKSLRALSLDYFDQYLLHWPFSPALYPDARERTARTWAAMEALREAGLTRSIGVCNVSLRQLTELLEDAERPPAVVQIELHPGHPQTALLALCRQRGIAVEAWSPLGNGALLENERIRAIGQRLRRSPAQICLRWCVELGALPVTKTLSPARMRENLSIFDFSLEEADIQALSALPDTAFSGLDGESATQFG